MISRKQEAGEMRSNITGEQKQKEKEMPISQSNGIFSNFRMLHKHLCLFINPFILTENSNLFLKLCDNFVFVHTCKEKKKRH